MHYAETVWINVIRVKQMQKKNPLITVFETLFKKKETYTHYFLEQILERKKVS